MGGENLENIFPTGERRGETFIVGEIGEKKYLWAVYKKKGVCGKGVV